MAVVSTTVGVVGGLLGRVLAMLQWRDWRWPVNDAPRMSWWRSWLFEATFHAAVCWWRRGGPTVVFARMFVNGAMVVVVVAAVWRPNSSATVVWLVASTIFLLRGDDAGENPSFLGMASMVSLTSCPS
jgi:hypothetical protein